MDSAGTVTTLPPARVPANEYERFLAALPEHLRPECRARLAGSGLSPDHPVFQLLADFYETNSAPESRQRDFLGEATLHADRSKQLLHDLQDLPEAILAKVELQHRDLLLAFARPLQRFEIATTHLERNVEALPLLLLSNRFKRTPIPPQFWKKPAWLVQNLLRAAWFVSSNHLTWIVPGSVCLAVALIILTLGAAHLSQAYESAYRLRLNRLEADSVQNTIALNRLLSAGITLKVERDPAGASYYVILQGAHQAACPISSPEGLAVEVWP